MKNNMKMISFAKHEIVVHRWRKRFIRVLTALVVAVVIIVALAIGFINRSDCGNAEKAPTPNLEELLKAATERENAHPITFIRSAKSYEGYKRFIL
jgi:peptidoglycan/LPS O-acetylase OafA/YrhL